MPNQVALVDRLETEHDNLRAALAWAGDADEIETCFRLAIAMWWFWRVRGPASEGRGWMERLLARRAEIPARLRAEVLRVAGDLAFVQGDQARAVLLFEESLALAQELGDPRLRARMLHLGAMAALGQGDDERARVLWEEKLATARDVGDEIFVALALNNLGTVARRQGEVDRAVALQEEALALAKAIRFDWATASILGHLADAVGDQGDYERAAALHRESLKRVWDQKDLRIFAGTLAGFAAVVAARGQLTRAARLCGAVDAQLEMLGVALAPAGQISYQRAMAAARSGLDEPAFRAAWAEGRTMTPEEVIADAAADAPGSGDTGGARLADSSSGGLTSRELEVLRLLVAGHADREIAAALFVSPRTVHSHVAHIFDKLGVNSRTAAATAAVERGLTAGTRQSR